MLHDMGREQYGRAAPVLFDDHVFKALLVHRIQPGKRLIQDQEVGLVGQRGQDLDFLRHAFRQFRNPHAGKLGQTHPLQKLIGALAAFTGTHTFQAREIGDDGARAHLLVEAALFGKEANMAQGIYVGRRAEQIDLPLIGAKHAKRHAQTGRLACAVRSKEADNGALGDGQGKVADCRKGTKALGDMAQFERGRCHIPSRSGKLLDYR